MKSLESRTPTDETIVRALAEAGPSTLTDLSEATGLPRSTLAHSVRRLVQGAVLRQHPPRPNGRGRPSRTYSLMSEPGPVAVLVAAAHGTFAGVVAADGVILSAIESGAQPADLRHGRAGQALEVLDEALDAAGSAPQDLSLAILGLPGPSGFEPRREHPLETPDLRSQSHWQRLQLWGSERAVEVLGRHLKRPTYCENDANLAALGEATSGAGAGRDTVLYVNLAHGTGGGLVLHGRLHRGRSRLAGEIGHLHTSESGQLCMCGARGCFWQTRSIPALLDDLAAAHERPYNVIDLGRAVEDDDEAVIRALVGFGHELGKRLADAVIYLDPDVIIIDGALGSAALPVTEGVKESVGRYAPPALARTVRIEPGMFGSTAPLAGAVALAHQAGLLEPSLPTSQVVIRGA
jgi:predicted NBD/HSP70 family sugar kinase